MNMVAHAYDLVFYLSSPSTLAYLWSDQRRYVVGFLIGLALLTVLAAVLFRADPSRVPRAGVQRPWPFPSLSPGEVPPQKVSGGHMQFYYENLYVSSFYASWAKRSRPSRAAPFWRRPQRERSHRSWRRAAGAEPAASHRISSSFMRSRWSSRRSFRQSAMTAASIPIFRSDDQALHQLRVETYGGASWLTEFSILAGVSTHAFGGMRHFVQTFTQNKLKETLPQVLADCGYRNVVFYPMMRNFVSNDRFYASIGLKEIFDMKSQGAPTAQERDRFYFDNALNEIDRHLKTSRKPMFT